MAKENATRRSKRQSKVDTIEDVEEVDNVKTVEGAPKEDQAEQDHQMDTAIKVKGSTSTVTISWDKKNEGGEVDDTEKGTNASDQMMDSEKLTLIISSADAVASTEDAPVQSADAEMKEEVQESGVKRKAPSSVEASPAKKTKLLNDGYCLFVGNLNNSKTFDEVKDSLTSYFMTQSLLVQDIRLHRSKKHAHVDLASELDLTKGLALNGEMMHDKPMKIAKAKVKSEEIVQKKTPAKDKKENKNEKCLLLKNIPYNTTKEDLLKIFQKAVDVRFPGGTDGPKKGVAFVEFENKMIAHNVCQQKQGVEIQGRILIVDSVEKPDVANPDEEEAPAPPSKTLFVSNLPSNVRAKTLKKLFQTAVSATVPRAEGKSRGFAFVEFAAVEDAEKVLQSSKNMKIDGRDTRVQFCKMQAKSEEKCVSVFSLVQTKTLIVMGLTEKTTAETLKSAFEGAFTARVTVTKKKGVSRMFGFVEFESDENCKAVKEAMEDCEIDGSKVTVAYAKAKGAAAPPTPGAQPAGKGGKGKRKGKKHGAGKPQDAVKEVEIKG
ncbi:nucleolin-like [Lycodopsis pacificus]